MPGPRDHQLDQPGERPQAHRRRRAAREEARRRGRRAHDRRVGMAKTRERKLEVAKQDLRHRRRRVRPARRRSDLRRADLHAGDRRGEWIDSAHETIEGIRLIKRELPGVLTILGVSNVSFGLDAATRARVLNSVFLHHCVEAGLDVAIVNPAHITPYAEISAESARWPTIWSSTSGRTRCSGSSSTSTRRSSATRQRREGRSDRGHDARASSVHWMIAAPQEGRHRGRARRGRRARGAGARAERRAAAGDEGRRRQVRRGRADPAVRAAVAPR